MRTKKRNTRKRLARGASRKRAGNEWGDGLRERLRATLRDTKMSQREFARRIDVASTRVSEWLAGRALPGAQNLRRMAETLGVSIDWLLLGGSAEPVFRGQSRSLAQLESDVAAFLAREVIGRLDESLRATLLPTDLTIDAPRILRRTARREARAFMLELRRQVNNARMLLQLYPDLALNVAMLGHLAAALYDTDGQRDLAEIVGQHIGALRQPVYGAFQEGRSAPPLGISEAGFMRLLSDQPTHDAPLVSALSSFAERHHVQLHAVDGEVLVNSPKAYADALVEQRGSETAEAKRQASPPPVRRAAKRKRKR